MNPKPFTQVPICSPDEFGITAAEPWFKVKVQLVERYVQSFIANAAARVDEVIIVDLCAGNGLYSVGHQKDIFPGAALLLMASRLPVSRWIFCEQDIEQAAILRTRVQRIAHTKNVMVLDDPADELAERLKALIPSGGRGNKVAVLCLADSFSFDISFATIEKLASHGFNFLMPFTWMMNSRADYRYYLEEQSQKLRSFLGIKDLHRLALVQSNQQFYKHLVRMYQNNMLVQGLNTALSVHKLDSRLMELPAYHIGFFSKKFSTKAILNDVQEQGFTQFEIW